MTFPQNINASASPEVQMNENFDSIKWTGVYSNNPTVSSGLARGYNGGRWGGMVYAGETHTFGSSVTTYVSVVRADGTLNFSTSSTNYNNATDYARVEKVVTGSSAVTSVDDDRAGPGGCHGGGEGGGGGGPVIAADVSVTDAGNYFTSSDVEGVLQEVGSALAGGGSDGSGGSGGLAPRDIVQLIHDTDIGEDVDDVGGFAVMHRLADLGECDILACGYVGNATYGPQCIAALNAFYGRANIPIGTGPSAYTGTDYYATELIAQQNNIDDDTSVETAYRLYRRVLAAAKDHSVTLMFSGQMTNLKALYESVADEYSPLNGEDLLLLKAKELVLLAGDYPSGSEHDLTSDAAAAQVVNDLHPDLPVIWSGYDVGDDVLTVSNQPTYSPVRISYDAFFANYPASSRPSWGALCTIYAVRGLAFGGDTYFNQSGLGANAVDGSGNNTFTTDGSKEQRYLTRALSAATFESRVQDLQDPLPKAAASTISYGASGLEFPAGTPIGSGGGSGVSGSALGIHTASYRGPGSGTDLQTTSTSFVQLGAYQVTIDAAVGDILECELNGSDYSNASTNYVHYQFTAGGNAFGPEAIRSVSGTNDVQPISLRARRVVQSGDISGGQVTVVVNWKTDSNTAKFSDGAAYAGLLTVKNLRSGSGAPVEHTVAVDITLDASHAWPNTLRVTGGTPRTITMPQDVFPAGPGPKIVAWGAAVTIAQGSGRTLRLAGSVATTGNRGLANGGVADIYVVDGAEAIVGGPGVT